MRPRRRRSPELFSLGVRPSQAARWRALLNHRIVERLRFLQQMRAHAKMLEFSIGDRVMFEPDARGPVIGVLTRYNKKTVTVLTENGERWNITPSLLRKAPTPGKLAGGSAQKPLKLVKK